MRNAKMANSRAASTYLIEARQGTERYMTKAQERENVFDLVFICVFLFKLSGVRASYSITTNARSNAMAHFLISFISKVLSTKRPTPIHHHDRVQAAL
jgi:hypothetical protein